MRHARTVEALVGSTPLVDLSGLTSSPATMGTPGALRA